jgi:hypothetical protein
MPEYRTSILAFMHPGTVFDDEATRLLGEAYDAVCTDLQDTSQPDIVREIIARRILEAAKKGERDPIRLRDVGVASLARIRGQ